MWQLAALAGANLLQGITQARASNKAAAAEAAAIQQANTQNTIRTAARAALIQAQLAAAAKQQAQAGFDIDRQKKQALGAASASAAASGTIGASVDAVQQEIDMAADEADSRLNAEWDLTLANAEQQLSDTVQSGLDALQSGRPVASVGSQALGLLLNTAASTASTYYMSKMNLGLGDKSGSTKQPSP